MLVVLLVDLGSRATWSLNAPFSIWRTVRNTSLGIGLAAVTTVLSGLVISAAPVVTDSVQATSRSWNLGPYAFLVGFYLLVATLLMYLVGGAVGLVRKGRARAAET